jgi:hypothetical protein
MLKPWAAALLTAAVFWPWALWLYRDLRDEWRSNKCQDAFIAYLNSQREQE